MQNDRKPSYGEVTRTFFTERIEDGEKQRHRVDMPAGTIPRWKQITISPPLVVPTTREVADNERGLEQLALSLGYLPGPLCDVFALVDPRITPIQ